MTGIAKCPVTIKQTYLRDHVSGGYSGRPYEFRQKGDTIIIDEPDAMITKFHKAFKDYGFGESIDAMNDEPDRNWRHARYEHSTLKNSIIANLLFPFTKKIPAGELPKYITFYDSKNYTTFDHMKCEVYGFENYKKKPHAELKDIVKYYREKTDRESGHDTILTIITFACNKLPAHIDRDVYNAKDKGISYDEFRERINFVGRLPSGVRIDIDEQLEDARLNSLIEQTERNIIKTLDEVNKSSLSKRR